jgi:hypothetical protein
MGAGPEYDTMKIFLFNVLYADGDEKAKLSALYDIIAGHE